MESTLLPLMLIASSLEMAVCFSCFLILLQFRHQTWDLPRRILTFITFYCSAIAVYRAIVTASSPFLNGSLELIPSPNVLMVLFTQIILYFYPRVLMKPDWLRWNNAGLYFILGPLVILGIVFLFFTGRWTPVYHFRDIMQNMGQPDVMLRVITLCLLFPYSFLYVFLRYNWRRSHAPRSWIILYSAGAMGYCLLIMAFLLTGFMPIRILQQLWEIGFFVEACNFELRERFTPELPAGTDPAPAEEPLQETWGEVALWDRVRILIEKDQVWRNPDLTLPQMAQSCGTNITYLSNAIKENTGAGFNAFINKQRIQFITDRMKQNPDQDMQQLYYQAGFRSRTSAWRNFKEIMGITPTEFRQSLNK